MPARKDPTTAPDRGWLAAHSTSPDELARWGLLAVAVVVVVIGVLVLALQHRPVEARSTLDLYVSPAGSDTALGFARSPLASIQKAIDRAGPGTTIHLDRGVYVGNLETRRSGTARAPIVIAGTDDPRDPASALATVVYGTGHVIDINHSWIRLEGFAIDGQQQLDARTPYPSAAVLTKQPSTMTAFKDKYQSSIRDGRLVYVGDTATDLTGVELDRMVLQGAGGECVRLRNSTRRSVVRDSVIRYCGLFAKDDSSSGFSYHNGEGVYIGTSTGSSDQPQAASDASDDNLVTGNVIDTFGTECVDIKEAAARNRVIDNTCRYNLEPTDLNGSNIEVRGDHNLLEGNTISVSAGFSVKLATDAARYDLGGNVVRRNTMSGSAGGSLISKEKGVTACGNVVSGDVQGLAADVVTAPCP